MAADTSTKALTPEDARNWAELVDRFTALGGVLDNVDLRYGPRGRGLFAKAPGRPVRIFVPGHLVVPCEFIGLSGGRPVLTAAAEVQPGVADLFALYAETLWAGENGIAATRRFLSDVASLPQAARDMLGREFGLSPWFRPIDDAQVLDQFLRTRRLVLDGRTVFMPILELINHDSGGPLVTTSAAGLELVGRFAGEITWRYRVADSFQMFGLYQILGSERRAFSLPFSVDDPARGLKIEVGADTVNRIGADGDIAPPKIEKQGGKLRLAFLLLADEADPRRPYRSFHKHIAPHLGTGGPAFFQGLLYSNRRLFLRLLATLEPEQSPIARDLRQMCRMQLETLCAVDLI